MLRLRDWRLVFSFIITAGMLLSYGSCRREDKNGSYRYYIRFTSEKPPGVQARTTTYYTGLGAYVTSLTPSRFVVKIGMLGFQDDTSQCPNTTTDMLQFVDGNFSFTDSIRIADFTANIQKEYQPKLYGRTKSNAYFTDPEITFTYFYLTLLGNGGKNNYIYNEIALPEAYRGKKLLQFEGKFYNNWLYWHDSVVRDNVLRIEYHPLVHYAFDPAGIKIPEAFIFGNTDSTFIFNPKGLVQPVSRNHIFCGETRGSSVRSARYTPLILRRPKPDEVLEMKATVSFDTENLVQVYAGADGVAYTADDIFVYAPQFWNRIQVTVNQL